MAKREAEIISLRRKLVILLRVDAHRFHHFRPPGPFGGSELGKLRGGHGPGLETQILYRR
jgi:hypothetical protein